MPKSQKLGRFFPNFHEKVCEEQHNFENEYILISASNVMDNYLRNSVIPSKKAVTLPMCKQIHI